MKVLVACEFSQTVTKAFRLKGHKAFSCDILPTTGNPAWHFQDDIRNYLYDTWDLIIAHPPCTHLAVSGAKHFAAKRSDGRQKEGIDFFMMFTKLACKKVCIEQPVGIMSKLYRKPDQIIQPYYFGEPFTKTTCLWLKGLPKLKVENLEYAYQLMHEKAKVNKGERHITSGGNSLPGWYNLPPGPERSSIRSQTFSGIANAMAMQWG